MLVSSGGDDQDIKLWSVDGLRLERTIGFHKRDVNDVAVSLDGSKVASASNDVTKTSAESVEVRDSAKRNALQPALPRTPGPARIDGIYR